MPRNMFFFVLSGAILLVLVGCASETTRISNDDGPTTLLLDPRDFDEFAQLLTEDLLQSKVLEGGSQDPKVMALDEIINNTGLQVKIGMLTSKIRVRLDASRKVVTTTTVGLGGKVEAPLARGLKDEDDFLNNKPKQQIKVDYTLSGEIAAHKSSNKDGDSRAVRYTVHLSLTSVKGGSPVWEGERSISKGRKQSGVGL